MDHNIFPSRPELKLRARTTMGQAFRACSALGAAVVVMALLADWFLLRAGGTFSLYYWDTASNDIPSSVSLSMDGLFAALRLEDAGVGFSVVITPAILLTFLLVRLAITVVLAPVRLGCLDNLWYVQRGEARPFRAVFVWYTDLRRAGKAIVLECFLWVEQLVLQGLLSIPALWVLVRSEGSLIGFTAAIWLLLIAQAAVWCIMTQFQPVRYQLARHPEQGVGRALGYGRAILTRRHGQYLLFRLSFIVWELLNSFAQGVFQIYLFPYQGLANMNWFEAVEYEYTGKTPEKEH